MKKIYVIRAVGVILFASCVLQAASVRADEGLSTPFADVRVGNFPLGVATRVRSLGGPDFLLQNKSDHEVAIQVDVLIPSRSELRGDAQPLPDKAWIQVVPHVLRLGAHQSAACDVIITVPDEKKFRNRTYQAMIWSHTQPIKDGEMALGVGLLSRLRFTTKGR